MSEPSSISDAGRSVKRLVFVVPADLRRPTGGNRYDLALTRALSELGTEVEQRPAPGPWPVATPADRQRLAELLHAEDPVLVDGLLACGAPEAVSQAVSVGGRVHLLVHMPLALDTGLSPQTASALGALEHTALHAATGVLATSRWAATDLYGRHGLDVVTVATPGVDPAPPSTGSTPPRLLQLASITPLKNQLTLIEALALIQDLPWTADLTGPLDVDPGYTAQVRAAIDRHRLAGRVRLTGPVEGERWHQMWDAADLLLLPSLAETWGMAVTEALAHGVPAVVSLGTGAQEALGQVECGRSHGHGKGLIVVEQEWGCGRLHDHGGGLLPGAVVRPGKPVELGAAIRHLLGAGREPARRAALSRRPLLRTWQDTAHDVLAALAPAVDAD
jgi:glycosyltransferase involved in cell wall biosynthesis